MTKLNVSSGVANACAKLSEMTKNNVITAWAVLDRGELKAQRCHRDCDPEYWITPKKPKRKNFHKDYTFVKCKIMLIETK